MSGAPVEVAGLQPTPGNFSGPLVAIPFEMSRCSTERKLTQKNPAWRIIGHAREVLAGQNITRGGSSKKTREGLGGHADGFVARHRGHHGDAGGEDAEYVAERPGPLGSLRVVDRDRRVFPSRSSKSKPVPRKESIS